MSLSIRRSILAIISVAFWFGLGLSLSSPGVTASPPMQVTATSSATPTSTAPVTSTLSPGARKYIVQPGDSPWTIAQKSYGNGSLFRLILQANNLPEDSRLRVGMILIVPPIPGATLPATPTVASVSLFTPEAAAAIAQANSAPQITAQPTIAFPTAVASSPLATERPNLPDPRTMFLVTLLNSFGVVCFTSSIICGVLSYDSFNRARVAQKRMRISNRVRARPMAEPSRAEMLRLINDRRRGRIESSEQVL